MSTSYADCSTEELLDRLKMAGRNPHPDLIEACLERPDDLTPGLLEMFEEADADAHWMDEDPRWFGVVHAGKLLMTFKEPDAIPLFADLLRDPERKTLLEWFDKDLHAFSPPSVPALVEIVQDDEVHSYGRNLSISALGQIARDHPDETRERVLEVLRAELPPTTSEGQPDLDRDPTLDDSRHWTEVALVLAELHDEESQSRVEALYEADLIDEFMIGDVEDYRAILSGDRPPLDYDFDVMDEYGTPPSHRQSSEPELVEKLFERLEQAGRYPRPKLIEDCVRYHAYLQPHLLRIFREDVRANAQERRWDDDDPRWYRMVHAGLLLLEARDEEALPVFVRGFRRTDIHPFGEWFGEKLRLYGPAAVPALTELLHDGEADVWGRMEAARELSHIAWAHPQTQDEILSALRRVLPTQIDESPPDVSDEIADILWTNVACELARHQDAESRPQIEALFEHDLLDPMVFGDKDTYRQIVEGDVPAWAEFGPAAFDVVDWYERWYEPQQQQGREPERSTSQLENQRREWKRGQESAQGGHYEEGTFVKDVPDVGRNDPCPCGSGAKYKYCCG
ncbi:MAG: hypothetical protein BRD31_01550 [Bacteroidetes bacterium QH_2_64_26]|nr:MAG: hypothetical protein BRD31_01550 [Bacteroidetes bacterium QH_2_64_26]